MMKASTRTDFAFWEYRLLAVLEEAQTLSARQVYLRCGARTNDEYTLVQETLHALVAMRVIDSLAQSRYALHGLEMLHE